MNGSLHVIYTSTLSTTYNVCGRIDSKMMSKIADSLLAANTVPSRRRLVNGAGNAGISYVTNHAELVEGSCLKYNEQKIMLMFSVIIKLCTSITNKQVTVA